MMRRRTRNAVLSVAALLAGCGSWRVPTNLEGTVNLAPSLSVQTEKLVFWGIYAGVAYLVLEPWAPNWEIEEAKFPGDHYKMTLHMKRYYAGGAGEAREVFHRRAKELVREGGFDSYSVVEYTEGLDSSVLGSRRTAEGVVALARKD